MKTISKEIRILAPATVFFLIGMLFSLFNKRLISNALLFYTTALYFIIVGVYWIFRDKDLSTLARIVWLFIVLSFNFIGVICYVTWKNMNRKPTNH